jgi:hypothetical protein
MAERKGLLTDVQYLFKLDKRKWRKLECGRASADQHRPCNSEAVKDCAD